MGALAFAAPNSAPPDAGVVQRMLSAAPHRGSQHATAVCGRFALGVAYDIAAPHAWLAAENGSAAVVVGSVDNAGDLRRELAAANGEAGGDPAEVVLRMFRAWGEEALTRLRGAFAGAVVDGPTLWYFRDQLGHRTLFERRDANGLYVATEAKQVVAGAAISREPDVQSAEDLFFGRLDTRRSLLAGEIGRAHV